MGISGGSVVMGTNGKQEWKKGLVGVVVMCVADKLTMHVYP